MKKLTQKAEAVHSCCSKNNGCESVTELPRHLPDRKSALLPQFENDINEYLSTCKEIYSESHQRNIRFRCNNFMRFIQNRGLTDASELGYEDILAYHLDVPHKERIDRMLYESSIKLFLSHLARKGMCSHGLGWYLHYLQSDRILTADAVAGIISEISNCTESNPLPLSAEEYRSLSEKLLLALKEQHLSGSITAVSENTFKLHFIYLDMNRLVYSHAQAIAWVDAAKGIFMSSWPTARRAVRLFDD